MKRPGPLRSNPATMADWRRRTTRPLPPQSDKRAGESEARRIVRLAVIARDRICQVHVIAQAQGRYVGPCSGPLTYGHRRKASQGGAYSMENGLAECVGHNCALEQNADLARWAHSVGLVVRRGDAEWASLGHG